MAITQLIKTYKNFDIYLRKPGFEFTPTISGKIASFIVQEKVENGRIAVFAFAYSLLDAFQDPNISEAALINKAVLVIESFIDENKITNKGEYPFEYKIVSDSFEYKENAPWWTRTTS